MITQNHIDTLTENLAAELNLCPYDHVALAEIVKGQLKELIDKVTKYPSSYFSADVLESAKAKAGRDVHGVVAPAKRGKNRKLPQNA